MVDLRQVLTDGFRKAETGWNMGSFGALAKFHHVAGDNPSAPESPLCQVTALGGVRIDRLEGVRPLAYETLGPGRDRWAHGVALCLREEDAALNRRSVLTELGPDMAALRAQDRPAVLFDLGLAQPQVDFCVRTADADLIDILRAQSGRPLLDPANPAMAAILAAHPHRVAVTRLGRVEVFQKIGGPETGGVSPEGPHTHVLPKLLRTGRTHSANVPVPEGWLPCATLHPQNPVVDRLGNHIPFNRSAYDAFQTLLAAWGPAEYMAAKAASITALDSGCAPEDHPAPATRLGRAGLRIALRQWQHLNGQNPLSERWRRVFDADRAPDGPAPDQQDGDHAT